MNNKLANTRYPARIEILLNDSSQIRMSIILMKNSISPNTPAARQTLSVMSQPLKYSHTSHQNVLRLGRSLSLGVMIASGISVSTQNAFADDATSLNNTQKTQDSSVDLTGIVVTASPGGVAQDINDAPASISVITREELESKPYRDLADALSSIPGLTTTGGSDHKEISIRGMSSAYTLTLIDGKRTDSRETSRLSDGLGQMNAWTPPISAIERIEIVRGPMSSLYGADAMGGVINIITRKVAKEWSGEVSTDALLQENSQSGNANQGSFFLTGPIKQDLLGLQLYGQYSKRDEDDIYNGYRDSKRNNITAKLALTPTPDHDIIFAANHTEQRVTQEPGKSIDPNCATYSYFGCATPYNKKVDVDRFSLSHTGRWTLGTSETYVQQETFNVSSQDVRLKNTEFRTSLAMPLEDHLVTVGGGSRHNKLHDSFSNRVTNQYDITRKQNSLFAEDDWYLTDTFTLTAGARLDDDNRYGHHWSPRVYGVWGITPQWTLKGGVTSGFKSPDMTKVASGYASASGLGNIYGNEDLKPEKSLSQEIGILYSNNGVTGGLTLFNNKFEDKITTVACDTRCTAAPSGTNSLTYANVDKAITRGVEANLGLPLSSNITWDNSYTFTYSKQESGLYKGKPLNKLPRHQLTSTLNYQPTDELTTWARLAYRGKDSDNVGGTAQLLSPVESPSFTTFDIGANYEINQTLSLRAAIYNLANQRISYNKYGFVEDARRYWLGITAKF
jgi:outer membrane receptor for ferrienterochelin and colicins